MADVCEGYSYWLAAEDVLPIIAFGVGFYYVSKRIVATVPQARIPVGLAAVLLVAGFALAGPIRKAFIAADSSLCESAGWMQLPAFTSVPACFAILAWAMLSVAIKRVAPWWPFAVAVVLIYGAAIMAGDTIVLLAGGGLLAVFFALASATVAVQQRDRITAVLFVLYAVGTLALPVLGSNDDRSAVTNQWIEQITNTVTLGTLALAGYLLLRSYQRTDTRSVLVEN